MANTYIKLEPHKWMLNSLIWLNFLGIILLSLIGCKNIRDVSKESLGENYLKVNQTSSTKNDFKTDGSFIVTASKLINIPIILPKNSTFFTEEAAKDLATYFEKIFGTRPKIIKGFPHPLPESAIWVGYQIGIENLFPGMDISFKYQEEVINIANDRYLLISGRDKWDPNNLNVPDEFGVKMVNYVQQEYGTCNAVYTFIQNQLKVRWLWPGTLGEDVISMDTMVIQPFYYRYHPQISDRSGVLYRTSLYIQKQSKEEQLWSKRQRMQLSSMYIVGSHAFTDWWKKYGIEHPEYFALNKKGNRKPLSNPEFVKICQSNPAVWKRWLEDVENQLKRNPTKEYFSAGANDFWSDGHCTCTNCRAWDHVGFDPKKPVLTDRDLRFVNILARMLKEKYPHKPYKVLALSYGYTRPAPKEVVPSNNVIVVNASNFLQRSDDEREMNMKQFDDWAKTETKMTWRPNLSNPVGVAIGMPDIAPHQAAIDMKFIAERGTIGVYFDTYWHHWATQGIQYYALAQLAWNPLLNIDSLLDNYFLRAYGDAHVEMKQYWTLLEETRNQMVNTVGSKFRVLLLPSFYTDQWFSTAETYLDNAKKKASGKFLSRIRFAEGGLKYAKLLVECRQLNMKWEKDKKNKILMSAIDKKFKEAQSMKANLSYHSIYFNRSFDKPGNKMMMGFHYRNPVNASIMSSINQLE